MSLPNTIPLFAPDFGPEEDREVLEVLHAGWIAMGPKVEAFEKCFADFVGAPHAVAVNSATAALHLANVLLGLRPGDEVIVPSLTFAATVNAVRFVGATPVFADVSGPDDWTIGATEVARRMTRRTRAVVVMHYAGYACDMEGILAVCRDARVAVVEDACHGLGGTVAGRSMGVLGDIGCFSFYSNKVMTTGEGGMLVTADPDRAKRARELRSHGMSATSIDRMRGAMGYEISELGWNYRLDDLRAAVGLAQLRRLPQALARRRALVERYRERLQGVEGLHRLVALSLGQRPRVPPERHPQLHPVNQGIRGHHAGREQHRADGQVEELARDGVEQHDEDAEQEQGRAQVTLLDEQRLRHAPGEE